MSTKKKTVAKAEPEVITATQVEAQAKKTLKKESPAKKCNCAPGQCHCGKKAPVKKDGMEYVVATLKFTKFKFDNKFKCTRIVQEFDITSKEDLSNKPEEAEKLISDYLDGAAKNGWSLNDFTALHDARKYVEHMLAAGAVELEYGKGRVCKRCLSERMRNLAEALRMCRAVACKRQEVYEELADKDCANMPAILPPMEEWKDYEVVDGKYVNTRPNVDVRCLKVSKEESEKLLSLLKSLEHGDK